MTTSTNREYERFWGRARRVVVNQSIRVRWSLGPHHGGRDSRRVRGGTAGGARVVPSTLALRTIAGALS